jgi:hypothetical protein
MNKPRSLLLCTSLSLTLAGGLARADSAITIPADQPDPPGYVCLLKRVGNGKSVKEVKVCTPKEKRHEPSGSKGAGRAS